MLIEVSNLTKKFNSLTAVDDISFAVEAGEILVLLGTSGCGKTTTLKMINRLIEPTSGEIRIKGENVQTQKPEELRKRIGYVIQNIGLFPHYTVEENIGIVPNLLNWDKQRITRRTLELMEMVGLPPDDFRKRYPEELSGGQQQRVGLVRALAADPPIVLLDEPFGALDPITRRQIQKEFKTLEMLLNKTIILVTHDVFEAFELAVRVCLMDQGKIQQLDSAKKMLFTPKNEFVKDFFQANRFQLELKVLTLKDILPEIEPKETSHENIKTFEETTNLLAVLESIEHTSLTQSIFRIKDTLNNQVVETTSEQVIAAFYKTRSKLSK
ncbi:MAG: ABC transporter ATP-binding protein [Thermodesulfobacteriota bacterium]|nr:ABC transporter ATP-binding protein [Thermodesulfobacteriota bacterium]